jgi:folate-binding protein YgfZ
MPQSPASPLQDLHRQAEADLTRWGDVEIVSTYGEPQAEYAAIRKAAGLIDLPQRGFLELTGKDRLTFLNNVLSAELWNKQTKQPMPAGRWAYSFLLNLKGRIVADMNVLELGERTIVETDVRLAEPLRGLLEAYLFAEKVKMENRSDQLHQIALHGPGALDVLKSVAATDAGPWSAEPQSCASLRILGYDVVAWRDDPTGVPGIYLIVPRDNARAIWMHFVTTFGQASDPGKRRLRPVGWAAFNAARVEAGRPVFGIDFDAAPVASAYPAKKQREQAESSDAGPGMLPAETGQLARAVSLSKCYIGQEIVARMHARGQVARRIVGIRMPDDALPIAGTQVLDADGNAIGIVTSSTNSPVLSNVAIALGTLKKPFYEVGTSLRVPAEGAIRTATVVATPFIPLESGSNSRA